MSNRLLPRSFFNRPAPIVAQELLGARLVHADGVSLRINETEAYDGGDPASHSFNGQTPRNAVMFGPPGHLYVYFIYGMHWCANIVTAPVGVGEAVLLRGATVLAGEQLISERRPKAKRPTLLDGPAKLCQSLLLTGESNGLDLCATASPLRVRTDEREAPDNIHVGPRIGITKGVQTPWRFLAAPGAPG